MFPRVKVFADLSSSLSGGCGEFFKQGNHQNKSWGEERKVYPWLAGVFTCVLALNSAHAATVCLDLGVASTLFTYTNLSATASFDDYSSTDCSGTPNATGIVLSCPVGTGITSPISGGGTATITCDSNNLLSWSITGVPASVSPVSDSPVTIGGGSVSRHVVNENQSKVKLVVAHGGSADFQIIGGNDAALFVIDDRNRLNFITPPDYENPLDADSNNTYEVKIQASGSGDAQVVYATIRDVEETSAEVICPVFNIIPDGGDWLNFDESIMLDLIAGADCDAGIVGSAQVARRLEFLYVGLLGRAIDSYGLAWWVNQAALRMGDGEVDSQVMQSIAQDFLNSDEFRSIAVSEGLTGPEGDLLNPALLSYLYNEMGREQDEAGFNYWLNYANTSGLAQLLTAFSASVVSTEDGGEEDALFIANRLALELAVLRAFDGQSLTLSVEQLKVFKATLLANREAVLINSLAPESFLPDL